jgi:hypothetical protein
MELDKSIVSVINSVIKEKKGFNNYSLVLNIGDIITPAHDGAKKLSVFHEINSTPKRLVESSCMINKKRLMAISQKLSNINKRIYKMKIYGMRGDELRDLPEFNSGVIRGSLPWVFYEAHRNAGFFFNELYEVINHGEVGGKNYVLKFIEKTTFKPDSFPILSEYSYESDIYDCVEFLLEPGVKVMSMLGDNDKCYLSVIMDINQGVNWLENLEQIVKKFGLESGL